MFCEYCGKEIDDDAKFCVYCGMKVRQIEDRQKSGTGPESPVKMQPGSAESADSAAVAPDEARQTGPAVPPVQQKSKSKALPIILTVVGIAVLGGIGFGAYRFLNSRSDDSSKSVKTETESTTAAEETEQMKGGAAAKEESTAVSASTEEVYAAYKTAVEKEMQTYGAPKLVHVSGPDNAVLYDYIDGVNFIYLVDFNQDGTDEMIVADNKRDESKGTYPSSTAKIYTFDGTRARIVSSDFKPAGREDGESDLIILKKDDGYRLVSGDPDSELTFWKYDSSFHQEERFTRSNAGSNWVQDDSGNEFTDAELFKDAELNMNIAMNPSGSDSQVLEALENSMKKLGISQTVGETTETESSASISSGASTESSAVADGDFIIPDSSSRYLTEAEIAALDDNSLRIAINEIYARHGRMFKDENLQNYFNSKSWYHPQYTPEQFDAFGMSVFNDYEIKNLDLFSKERSKRGF